MFNSLLKHSRSRPDILWVVLGWLFLRCEGLGIRDALILYWNIQKVGTENGYNVYTWDWNNKAKSLGLTGSGKGVIADEVKQVKPEAVKRHQGFDTVDYELIGVKHG